MTVRESYSAGGDAWNYFIHDQLRSRAYQWGEDGTRAFPMIAFSPGVTAIYVQFGSAWMRP